VYQYIDLIARWGFYIGTFATIEPEVAKQQVRKPPAAFAARREDFLFPCRVYQSISTIEG